MKALLGIVLLLMCALAHAQNSSQCLSEERVFFFKELFDIQTNRSMINGCDSSDPGFQIVTALKFIDEIRFGEKLPPHPYNQNILPSNWLDGLKKQNLRIHWGPKKSMCNKGNWAAANESESRSKIYVCPLLFNSPLDESSETGKASLLQIVSTIFHEQRHLQGVKTGFAHVDCHGNKGACDPSIEYKGAYAVDVESLAKIGVSANNVHPAMAAQARSLSFTLMELKFVKAPSLFYLEAPTTDLMILQAKTGYFYTFDGKDFKNLFGYLPVGNLWVLGLNEWFLFPSDTKDQPIYTTATDFYSLASPQPSKYFSEVLKTLSEQRLNIKDILVDPILGKTMAYAKGQTVHVIKRNTVEGVPPFSYFTFSIPQGEIISLRHNFVESTQLSMQPNGFEFFVFNDSGQAYKINMRDKAMTEVQNPYAGLKEVARINGRTYAIDFAGNLLKETSENVFRPFKEGLGPLFSSVVTIRNYSAEEMPFGE